MSKRGRGGRENEPPTGAPESWLCGPKQSVLESDDLGLSPSSVPHPCGLRQFTVVSLDLPEYIAVHHLMVGQLGGAPRTPTGTPPVAMFMTW